MAEPVRIVYLINSLDVGGAEIGMCRLLDGLDEERYDVTVVPLDGRPYGLDDRIPPSTRIIRLYSGSPNLREIWEFLRAARKADVIIGSLFHAALVAKLVGILNRDATVATWRHNSRFKTRRRETAFKLTVGLTNVILADSTVVARTLIDEIGIDASKIHTVPIAGLDLGEYTMVTHEQSGKVTVGSVGRLTEQKNFEAILTVAKRLEDTEITFEIAGDGELYNTLQKKIIERDLQNVTLCGFVEDVPSFLEKLDIYVQPSRWEGLCITVLEAMAAGLPVVGSDVGGIGQNVEEDASGYLYEPDDVDGFVSGIETLAQDPELRQRFGERGRGIVREGFTQELLVSEFKDAIHTVE